MKFKIGDVVYVKKDLVIGEKYYNNDGITCDTFSMGMVSTVGKKAVIVGYSGEKYLLDIGFIYNFTDGMLEAHPNEVEKIKKSDALEANQLLEAILNKSKEEMLNKALDEKLYVHDKEGFERMLKRLGYK